MLMVAPMGRMNLAILGSTLQPSSRLATVTGRVAELLAVPKAVAKAGPICYKMFSILNIKNVMIRLTFPMNLNGRDLVAIE